MSISESLTGEQLLILLLAFAIFFIGNTIVATRVAAREKISLIRVLFGLSNFKNTYKPGEKTVTTLILLTFLALLVYVFR